MERGDSDWSNILETGQGRRRVDDTKIDQLISGISLRFKELEQKNRQLEGRNAELVSALEQGNERVVRFEQAATTNRELTKIALRTAAQMLGTAEEAVATTRKAVEAEIGDRYAKALGRLLELQKEAFSLLEGARDESVRRNQEVEQKTAEAIRATRESLLSMVESLAIAPPDQRVVPVNTISNVPPARIGLPQQGEPDNTIGHLLAVETTYPAPPAVPPNLDADTRRGAQGIEPTYGVSEGELAWEDTDGNKALDGQGGYRGHLTELDRFTTQVADGGRQVEPERSVSKTHLWANEGRALFLEPFAELAEAQAPGQSIELVATQIHSFATLSRFHRAVQQMPGVVNVKAKGFDKGKLHLIVRYSSATPLLERLAEMPGVDLQVVSAQEDKVEVTVFDKAEFIDNQQEENR